MQVLYKFSIKTFSLHFSFMSAMKFTCNFFIKPLSTLIVYEYENQNNLSTFLVYENKKDSVIRRFNRVYEYDMYVTFFLVRVVWAAAP